MNLPRPILPPSADPDAEDALFGELLAAIPEEWPEPGESSAEFDLASLQREHQNAPWESDWEMPGVGEVAMASPAPTRRSSPLAALGTLLFGAGVVVLFGALLTLDQRLSAAAKDTPKNPPTGPDKPVADVSPAIPGDEARVTLRFTLRDTPILATVTTDATDGADRLRCYRQTEGGTWALAFSYAPQKPGTMRYALGLARDLSGDGQPELLTIWEGEKITQAVVVGVPRGSWGEVELVQRADLSAAALESGFSLKPEAISADAGGVPTAGETSAPPPPLPPAPSHRRFDRGTGLLPRPRTRR